MRMFRFALPPLNYAFVFGVLLLPFLALRPVLQLSRWPRILGCIIIAPILLLSLLLMATFVACGNMEVRHDRKDSCIQELGKVEQGSYSVHLLKDCGGGATVSFTVWLEQDMPLVPGLYLFKSLDSFYGAYEGSLTAAGPHQVHLRIPRGVEGSGWHEEVDRVYQLKPHVYF